MCCFALTSCGGGSGGPGDSDEISIAGSPQKGLFTFLQMNAYPVDLSDGSLGDRIEVDVSGQNFSVSVANNQLTLFEAKGEFTSEITGNPVFAEKPLKLMLAPGSTDVNANINIATTLIAELVLRDLRAGGVSDVNALLQQHTEFINRALGFPAGTDPSQLDFNDITESSDMSDPNLQLLVLSGGLVEMLLNNKLYSGGFQNIVDGIVAAENDAEAAAVLGVLEGVSATAIYALAREYSGFELPTAIIGGNLYVWVCELDGPCQWIEETEPRISVSSISAFEAEGTINAMIRLNEKADANMEVHVTVTSGTATAGEDFIAIKKTVLIPVTNTFVRVPIELIIDALPESTERFEVSIEAGNNAYPVFQRSATLTVYDGVRGSQDSAAARDPAGLALTLDVQAICNPVLNMGDEDCLALTGNVPVFGVAHQRANVAKTLIDIVSDCAGEVCDSDRIIDFFLVADDTVGITGETALGSYLFDRGNIRGPADSFGMPVPVVRLTDPDSMALAAAAALNDWDLRVEGRIGTSGNAVARTAIPQLIEAPDTVLVGDTLFDLGLIYDVMPGTDHGCTLGQYAIDAQYIQPQSGSIVGSGIMCVNYDTAGVGAGPAIMTDGQLDLVLNGRSTMAGQIDFALPPGLYAEITLERSSGEIETSTEPGLRFISVSAFSAITSRLHSEGWPFKLVISRLSLTPDGVNLSFSDMDYVMDPGYSSQDPRSQGVLYSNDIFYRGVKGQSGSLALTQQGVSGSIAVQGGPLQADHTAFPRARVEWQSFNQSIIDNELQATSIDLDEFRLGQSTACDGPQCLQGHKDWYTANANMLLDNKGFALGNATIAAGHREPRWGAREAGDFAWSRPDDLNAQTQLKLALPGYRLTGERVADVLLAHLDEPTSGDQVVVYPAGSPAFRDGNYHPVGLSVGPEIYRGVGGTPQVGDGQDLGGLFATLRIDNGQDPAFDLISAPAVKYVIRNAGITGTFNVASGSLAGSAPQFYGYPIELTRFAVRSVDNTLDTVTWIDGSLALKGAAGGDSGEGLNIHFTNMQIDCSARLGNIDLLYESCDAVDNNGNSITDENCNAVLHAWQAETDIFAAGFTGNDAGQSCSVEPQQFSLQHQLHFKALDEPVAFETVWDAAGNLSQYDSGQLPSYRFDRSMEGNGFPVKTSNESPQDVVLAAADVDGAPYGWLEFRKSEVGVPFWNSLQTDLRVANTQYAGAIAAEPTVVVKEGVLDGLDEAQRNKNVLQEGNALYEADNQSAVRARYQWGGTGFGFELPVYYQPWQLDNGRSDIDAEGRQSRFLGRQLKKDLFVLDANAGINFIEPDRTKLSFGASADFTRLEGIEFQLDIADPRSAAAVDRVLLDLRVISQPLLEPAVTELLDTLDIANRFANRGMDELLRESLELAVLKAGEAAAPLTPNNQDPFVTASEVLTQIQSMPQQMVAVIEEDLEAPLNNQLAGLKSQLRAALLDMEGVIINLNNVQSPADRIQIFQDIKDKEQQVRDIVEQVEREVRKVDTQLTLNISFSLDLLQEASAALAQVTDAINRVNDVIDEATMVSASACSNGLVVNPNGAGFIQAAASRVAKIREVANIIRGTNAWLSSVEALAQNEADKRRLAVARERIQDATEELLEFVNNADLAVSGVICVESELNAVADKAKEFTARILGELQAANDAVGAAYVAMQNLNALKDLFAQRVYEPIAAVRAALEPSTNDAQPGNGTKLNRGIGCMLYNASHDAPLHCDLLATDPVPFAQAPLGMNALANNQPGERDIADVLFDAIDDEVESFFHDVKQDVRDATSDLMPGAYMTPEQLRRTLVTEILRSAPVQTLREEMDRHFGEVAYAVNNIGLQIVDQINFAVEGAVASVTGPINDALSDATSAVRGIPLQSAGINGFATIAGNELERAHLSAGWTMRGGEDNDKTGFKAALDAESWSAKHTNPDVNTPSACAVGAEESLLDVKISAYGLPINVLAADIDIEKLYLGFTLKNGAPNGPALIPIGIFGGINTVGEIGFSEAIVFDPAFAAGLGTKQTYIGASAGAIFSSLTADVAFLVGRVCPGNTAITDLDPEVEKFLPNLPASGFTGAYLRGGATIPVIPGGCALNVGVVADFGSWIFVGQPTTFGGLVGGGASGQVACIAALKGKVTVGGSASTDGELKLVGEGWGVAGIGLDCDPGTWTSVARSREDGMCGTGDAQFGASFDNGKWKVNPPKPSAIH
tara:strand:- start:18110 stop:24736 length:6627 start_codon:yes stop_codon:yes gene_type:complete